MRNVAGSILLLAGSAALAEDPPAPLFDGRTTDGWLNPYDWGRSWIDQGVVHLEGNRKFFLVTRKTYGDFVLEAEVNVPLGGNSGIQFRCHYKKNRLWGYQAEVDTSDRRWAGGIYDEGRRAWIAPLTGRPEAQAAFRNGEWNRYRIEAIGDHLRVWVNGILTSDIKDPLDIEGHVALQHHGEKGLVYRFRNVRLAERGRHVWKPLFDGKTLQGWHARPGGTWAFRDGVLVGTSPAAEKRHGLLVSDARYGDVTVRLEFRVVKGNSGFYFRANEVDKPAAVEGFQAEIDRTYATGGLYETYGRAWVVKPDEALGKKHYQPGEWARMAVSARGRRIVVHVNGRQTAELKDDPGRIEGHLALQLHGNQDMHVEFKDVEILLPEGHR